MRVLSTKAPEGNPNNPDNPDSPDNPNNRDNPSGECNWHLSHEIFIIHSYDNP